MECWLCSCSGTSCYFLHNFRSANVDEEVSFLVSFFLFLNFDFPSCFLFFSLLLVWDLYLFSKTILHSI